VLVRFRELEHQRPFSRDEEQVNPHQALEDPARRGVLDRSPLLIGNRHLSGFEGGANALFQGSVHQQTHGHDHQEGHHPLRFFYVER
jgi:hypothetical protein